MILYIVSSVRRTSAGALTSKETAKICRRVCQLVFLVVSVLERNEDAEIVCSSHNAHTGSGELGAKLVVSSRAHAFLWTVDVEGRDRRVVGSLFGKVGDGHRLAVASNAVGAARGR